MEKTELIESLKKLKAGYISSLNSLEVMKNWGRIQLEALYSTKIGKFKIRILELQIQFKSLRKKIQYCHQAINRDETPDFEAIEEAVKRMEAEAGVEIDFEKGKLDFSKQVLSHLASPERSMELRKIYRRIAKALHPDVNPNQTEDQQDIWIQFYRAYKDGDLEKMKALEVVYEAELKQQEVKLEDLSEEEILLQTAMLKQGIQELEAQIKKLEGEFPFSIAEQIRDDEWVAEQQDLLKKEIAELEVAVKEKEEIYQLIRETYE